METLQDLQIGVPPISPPAPALNWKPYIVATNAAVYLCTAVWHQISKVYRELLTGSQGGCDLSYVDAIFEIVARIGSNCESAQRCTMPLAPPPPPAVLSCQESYHSWFRCWELGCWGGGGNSGKGWDMTLFWTTFRSSLLAHLQHKELFACTFAAHQINANN
jgi:hypothetical protein